MKLHCECPRYHGYLQSRKGSLKDFLFGVIQLLFEAFIFALCFTLIFIGFLMLFTIIK